MGTPGEITTDAERSLMVPALDPRAPYSSRLSSRSALFTDLQLLLDDRPDPLPSEEYRKLVVEGNCLTRSSTAGRAKLWAELRKRYLMDRRRPLYEAFWSEWRRSKSDSERGLTAYTLLALNDRLVADLGMQWLYIYLRRAPAELRVAEVLNFIRRAGETGHPEVREWTEDTQLHVAQHYMASIRDFGLARGKSKKFSQRPALYAAPVRLLVRVLRLASVKDLEILTSPVFRLLAIEGAEVIDALGELNQLGELRFRMQADVVELKIGGAE
ncbi:MAG: BrxA family protein [Terracidiphilus sp.]